MAIMKYAEALAAAVHESMAADPSVVLVAGSMMGLAGSAPMAPVRADFADRILEPPISEAGLAGICIGAAMNGARPILPFGTGSFSFRAWDQILHEAGSCHYMSNGATTVPMVFHMLHGLRGGGAAQHSYSPQAMMWNCPGLEIVLPSSPADVKGLFRTAIKSNNPTLFIDHAKLTVTEGEVPDGDYDIPFGVADIKRAGGDVTIVATSLQVLTALEAAETLAAEGIEAEVVDLRTLAPFDADTVLSSVAKTGRLAVVDECTPYCSVASEVAAMVAEDGFDLLKAPIRRINRLAAPTPYAAVLEEAIAPTAGRVADAVRALVG